MCGVASGSPVWGEERDVAQGRRGWGEGPPSTAGMWTPGAVLTDHPLQFLSSLEAQAPLTVQRMAVICSGVTVPAIDMINTI